MGTSNIAQVGVSHNCELRPAVASTASRRRCFRGYVTARLDLTLQSYPESEVVTEALRMYFRARGGKAQLWSLVMPTVEEGRVQADYGAFADEWGSEHDAVYDKLGK